MVKNGQKWLKMINIGLKKIKKQSKIVKKQKLQIVIFLFIIKLNIKKMMKNDKKTLYFDQKRTKIIK